LKESPYLEDSLNPYDSSFHGYWILLVSGAVGIAPIDWSFQQHLVLVLNLHLAYIDGIEPSQVLGLHAT